MQGKITYHQQISFCGKPRCKKCREGIGHGPYWYAYETHDGHTTRTYIGKQLPPDVIAAREEALLQSIDASAALSLGTVPLSAITLQTVDSTIAQGNLTSAVSLLDQLLINDPANEAIILRLLLVLAALKRRGEALRTYQRFADVLQRMRGTAPSSELKKVYEQIRRGETLSPSTNIPAPSPVEEAHQPSGKEAAIPVGRSHQSPLVGRKQELQVLRSMLLEAEQYTTSRLATKKRAAQTLPLDTQRRPHCVVLMGDAGIGKTRLAEEVAREAQQRGWLVLWSRSYSQESGIPYRLWTDILRGALNYGGWNSEDAALLHSSPTEAGVPNPLAFLATLASLLPELHLRVPQSLPGLYSAEHEQLRLWEAARDLFTTLSDRTPLVMVLDDVQWSDASSSEMLGYLARHVHRYPILLICTCRENEISNHPLRQLIAHMQREHSVKVVHVEPLTSEQIGQLIAHIPDTRKLAAPFVQQIQAQAAGNPFFAEELARITPSSTSTPLTLPKTVTAALDHRIGKLSKDCQQLLGNASVLGGSFALSVLCTMETTGRLANEDDVLDLLDEALTAGVLTEEGLGTRITYHFWHPLLVTHLYERMSATRRIRLHQRAAEGMQRLYAGQESEVAATITHHLIQGGAPPLKVAHYATMAGDAAYTLSAYQEAEGHYRTAVAYISKVSATSIPLSQQLYLLEQLAECTNIRGNFEEARALYTRIIELRKQHDTDTTREEQQYEAQVQALLWGEIGRTWSYTGDMARAHECCQRGMDLLRAADVATGLAWARLYFQQAGIFEQEGRNDEGTHIAQQALAIFAQFAQQPPQAKPTASASANASEVTHPLTRIQRTLQGDPIDLGRTSSLLGRLASNTGQLTKALDYLNTALALYEQYEKKREIAHVTCNMGYIYHKKANYTAAQAALRRSFNLAESIGDEPLTSVVYSNMAELSLSLHHLSEAEDLYRRALALTERFKDRSYMSRWNVGLGRVLQAERKFEDAIHYLALGLRIGRAMHNHPCISNALVAIANMRIAQAKLHDPQLTHLHGRLLANARRLVERALGLDGIEAETRLNGQLMLAHIALLLGNTAQAQAEISHIRDQARSLELLHIADRAEALL
jgi:predicted ATPase